MIQEGCIKHSHIKERYCISGVILACGDGDECMVLQGAMPEVVPCLCLDVLVDVLVDRGMSACHMSEDVQWLCWKMCQRMCQRMWNVPVDVPVDVLL